MRVLHVMSDIRRGGRERQLFVLIHYSPPEMEHHIAVFHNMGNDYLNEYNIPKIKFLKNNKLLRFYDLYKYVKENKIDLIHSWGNSETIYSIPARLFLKKTLLNGSVLHGVRKQKLSHYFRSFILRRSKYILANSFAGLYTNKIKVNNERHFVIHNGVEDKFFVRKNFEKRKQFNSEKNLTDDAIIFISIANFHPYKEYFTPLEVIASLVKEGVHLHYIIVGWGPLEKAINDYIVHLNLGDKVTIYSNRPYIPDILSISDIMLHSSEGEGCSNAILEAKAAGCIVVASETGGTPEIVGSKDFLFEYKNREDLTAKIKAAVKSFNTDPDIRSKIQEETRSRHSVMKYYNQYKAVLEKITPNGNFKTNLIQEYKNL
jgi:glycosyltransferase involved in cell wall biosynthesis